MAMLTPVINKGIKKCCAYNSEQMSASLQMVMQKQEKALPEDSLRDSTLFPVSAHKRLYPPFIMNNLTVPLFENNKLVMIQFKMQNDPLVEHAHGVEVHQWGFRISHSGLYFVYSSIFYSPAFSLPCKNFKYQTWGQYVDKFVEHYPGRSGNILKAFHTCCDECANDKETSFMSGVFNLQKGDILRVYISGHGLVSFKRESNFAGLTMISGGGSGDS